MKLWFSALATVMMLSPWGEITAQDSSADTPEERREVRRLQDLIGDEGSDFSMEMPNFDLPQTPIEQQPNVVLPDRDLDDRLQNILAQRAFNPGNEQIEAELAALLDEVEDRAQGALSAGDLDRAGRYSTVIAELDPDRAIVSAVEGARAQVEEVQRLLSQADQALASGNLIEPPNASAWVLYLRVLDIEPDEPRAVDGVAAVRERSLERFDKLLDDSDFEAAAALLDSLEALDIQPTEIGSRRDRLAEAQADQRRSMISAARSAIDDGDFDAAEQAINDLIAFGADTETIAQLRRSLEDAQRYAGFEPGQLLQDGIGSDAFGPVMIVVPSGSFLMGSPDNEKDRLDNEGPRFRVNFSRGFALARNEISVGEFRGFVEQTGYVTDAERRGSSRVYMSNTGSIAPRDGVTWRNDFEGGQADDALPVIHVSWNDAEAYVRWLSSRTDRNYRLPSEAEFEYALRAGSQTLYWWGDDRPVELVENLTGEGDRFRGGRSWEVAFRRYEDGYWGPAPVGSLQLNPFGLYDMGGNVMEWVEDCWHDSYVRAPTDGSAWVNPGCNRRVIRGGQWSSTPAMSRSAYRLSAGPTTADARVGFRVARDL